jgi:hypothetical protein
VIPEFILLRNAPTDNRRTEIGDSVRIAAEQNPRSGSSSRSPPYWRPELPMPTHTRHETTHSRGLAGRALIGAAVGSLVFAGLLLWGSRGDAVFGDMVLAAIAWCF